MNLIIKLRKLEGEKVRLLTDEESSELISGIEKRHENVTKSLQASRKSKEIELNLDEGIPYLTKEFTGLSYNENGELEVRNTNHPQDFINYVTSKGYVILGSSIKELRRAA